LGAALTLPKDFEDQKRSLFGLRSKQKSFPHCLKAHNLVIEIGCFVEKAHFTVEEITPYLQPQK